MDEPISDADLLSTLPSSPSDIGEDVNSDADAEERRRIMALMSSGAVKAMRLVCFEEIKTIKK